MGSPSLLCSCPLALSLGAAIDDGSTASIRFFVRVGLGLHAVGGVQCVVLRCDVFFFTSCVCVCLYVCMLWCCAVCALCESCWRLFFFPLFLFLRELPLCFILVP